MRKPNETEKVFIGILQKKSLDKVSKQRLIYTNGFLGTTAGATTISTATSVIVKAVWAHFTKDDCSEAPIVSSNGCLVRKVGGNFVYGLGINAVGRYLNRPGDAIPGPIDGAGPVAAALPAAALPEVGVDLTAQQLEAGILRYRTLMRTMETRLARHQAIVENAAPVIQDVPVAAPPVDALDNQGNFISNLFTFDDGFGGLLKMAAVTVGSRVIIHYVICPTGCFLGKKVMAVFGKSTQNVDVSAMTPDVNLSNEQQLDQVSDLIQSDTFSADQLTTLGKEISKSLEASRNISLISVPAYLTNYGQLAVTLLVIGGCVYVVVFFIKKVYRVVNARYFNPVKKDEFLLTDNNGKQLIISKKVFSEFQQWCKENPDRSK